MELSLIIYFINAVIEMTNGWGIYPLILFVFKLLLSVGLIILYWKISIRKSVLFFMTTSVLLLSNLLFIPKNEKIQLLATLIFVIYQILLIVYIIKLTKLRDYIPLLIAIIPFLFVFFYLFSISAEIPIYSYYILVIQNILVSVIGAIALSNYTMNRAKKNPWMLIFGLFSVALYLIGFIEKHYLSEVTLSVFKAISLGLIIVVYYTFYKFVIETERFHAETALYDN